MTTKGAHHPFPELCCSRARLNMTKPNPKNEIIKREYFRYLREAGGPTRRQSTAWRSR